MADTCTVCYDSTATSDGVFRIGCGKTPEGLCPKYWLRDATGNCTESWNCLQYSNIIHRVIGVLFLLVALIYARIIYYRSVHADELRKRTITPFEMPHCSCLSLSGIFIFIYKFTLSIIERYPPQNFARFFLMSACAIRGFDIVLLFRHTTDPHSNCPACFPSDGGVYLAKNLVLNLPAALMFISCLLVIQFWIDIHARCVEMTKSTVAGGFGDKIFSKIVMYWTGVLWTILMLVAGYLGEFCTAPGACSGGIDRYLYNVIVVLWILQFIAFCMYWGRKVAVVVAEAQNMALMATVSRSSQTDRGSMDGDTSPQLSLINNVSVSDISILQCCKVVWQPFTEVMTFFKWKTNEDGLEMNSVRTSRLATVATNSVSVNVAQTAQVVIEKLQKAVARVRYVQFIAALMVIGIVVILVVGTALGYYSSGADPKFYFAFIQIIRVCEILYSLGFAIFLAM